MYRRKSKEVSSYLLYDYSTLFFNDFTNLEMLQQIILGCGGNGNNYVSKSVCEKQCVTTTGSKSCSSGVEPLTIQGKPFNCAQTPCPAGYKCSATERSSICCPFIDKTAGFF